MVSSKVVLILFTVATTATLGSATTSITTVSTSIAPSATLDSTTSDTATVNASITPSTTLASSTTSDTATLNTSIAPTSTLDSTASDNATVSSPVAATTTLDSTTNVNATVSSPIAPTTTLVSTASDNATVNSPISPTTTLVSTASDNATVNSPISPTTTLDSTTTAAPTLNSTTTDTSTVDLSITPTATSVSTTSDTATLNSTTIEATSSSPIAPNSALDSTMTSTATLVSTTTDNATVHPSMTPTSTLESTLASTATLVSFTTDTVPAGSTIAPTATLDSTIAPTASVDSTIPTTDAVTTPDDTTTPTASAQYPTRPPYIDNAVFTFQFDISLPDTMNLTSFATRWHSSIKNGFQTELNRIQGFSDIGYVVPSNAARRKRDTSGTKINCQCNFTAADLLQVNTAEFQSNLTDAIDKVNSTTLSSNDLTLDAVDIEAFVGGLSDVCNAEGVRCDRGYTCKYGACYFRCEDEDCGDHGVCYIPDFGNDKDDPKCRCESDDVYNYKGEKCDSKSLQEKWVAVIGGCVSGFLLLIVVVLVVCFCRHRRRVKKQKQPYLDAYETPDASLHEARIATKHRTAYDNGAYQADGYYPPTDPDVDLPTYQDLNAQENGRLMQPSPMLSHFADKPFVIRRPKLVPTVRPRTEM